MVGRFENTQWALRAADEVNRFQDTGDCRDDGMLAAAEAVPQVSRIEQEIAAYNLRMTAGGGAVEGALAA